jgi:hypothetical protein
MREPLINFHTRRVGGLRFFWLGRFVFSFCIRAQLKDPRPDPPGVITLEAEYID